jgi:hypothetical protein
VEEFSLDMLIMKRSRSLTRLGANEVRCEALTKSHCESHETKKSLSIGDINLASSATTKLEVLDTWELNYIALFY